MKRASVRVRPLLMLGVAGMLLPLTPVAAMPAGLTIAQGIASTQQMAGSLNILQKNPVSAERLAEL